MIGNEEDFTACLGFRVEGADENLLHIEVSAFMKMIETAVKNYPNFKAAATTLRAARTATAQRLGRHLLDGRQIPRIRKYPDLEILDRVGGGDSFASGLIYGLMTTGDPQKAVDYGAAHGALAMTTPGDTSMASKAEVEKLMKGGSARVQRLTGNGTLEILQIRKNNDSLYKVRPAASKARMEGNESEDALQGVNHG